MDRSKQRDIASKGGKAAHQKGTAHEWTSEEAREAGRKGGMASHRRKQQQSASEMNVGSEQMVASERDRMRESDRSSDRLESDRSSDRLRDSDSGSDDTNEYR